MKCEHLHTMWVGIEGLGAGSWAWCKDCGALLRPWGLHARWVRPGLQKRTGIKR